ncbi:MAG: c-type cytochrome [Rhodobacterales bacterium]|nr:c-type cytochrome [Rhodobacterales bacterium]
MFHRVTQIALAAGLTLAIAGPVAAIPAAAQGLSGHAQVAQAEQKPKRHPGKRLYMRNTCIACHGRDGAMAIMDYPNVAGQDEKYIIAQIEDIMEGKRTGSPDATGNPRAQGMRGALVTPEGQPRLDKETIKTIADWLASLEPAKLAAPETPLDPNNVAAGEKLYAKMKCRTCHGKDGNKPLKGYPYIAGQKRAYLVAQMTDIRDKKRTNGKVKAMYPMIKKASDDDIAQLADYLSQVERASGKK